jgi:hypothetical protein
MVHCGDIAVSVFTAQSMRSLTLAFRSMGVDRHAHPCVAEFAPSQLGYTVADSTAVSEASGCPGNRPQVHRVVQTKFLAPLEVVWSGRGPTGPAPVDFSVPRAAARLAGSPNCVEGTIPVQRPKQWRCSREECARVPGPSAGLPTSYQRWTARHCGDGSGPGTRRRK